MANPVYSVLTIFVNSLQQALLGMCTVGHCNRDLLMLVNPFGFELE